MIKLLHGHVFESGQRCGAAGPRTTYTHCAQFMALLSDYSLMHINSRPAGDLIMTQIRAVLYCCAPSTATLEMLIYRGDSPGGHFVPDFRNRYRRLRVGGHAFYIFIHLSLF